MRQPVNPLPLKHLPVDLQPVDPLPVKQQPVDPLPVTQQLVESRPAVGSDLTGPEACVDLDSDEVCDTATPRR